MDEQECIKAVIHSLQMSLNCKGILDRLKQIRGNAMFRPGFEDIYVSKIERAYVRENVSAYLDDVIEHLEQVTVCRRRDE